MNIDLKFAQDKNLGQLVRYMNSNFVGDLYKHRLIIYYLFTLARNPISWRSTFQSIVALSKNYGGRVYNGDEGY